MRSMPTITKNLLIINIVAFVASLVLGARLNMNDIFGLHMFLAPDFHVYQFFTYMFMHAGWAHLFFNMFALWMFGCVVERVWGPRKFLLYYIVCGVGAGLFQEAAQFVQFYIGVDDSMPGVGISDVLAMADSYAGILNQWTTVGASGAIYAILLAFGMTFPEERIFIFPLPVPIKAKWFVILYAALEVFQALGTPGDGVAHLAHLGGMVFGYFMIRYWNRHPGAGYGIDNGRTFFDGLRSAWERRSAKRGENGRQRGASQEKESNPDWEYNMRKKAEQDEIDRILDKIRRNGYDSLTREEKQRLFDNSRNR